MELDAAEEHLTQAEARAVAAEQRFAAAGPACSPRRRQRIMAVAERWPELPASSVAIVAGSSPGHVSKVLREENGR